MIYYVSEKTTPGGWGTKEHPFKTISEAAAIAKPGDEVIVAPGITGKMSIRPVEEPMSGIASLTGQRNRWPQ